MKTNSQDKIQLTEKLVLQLYVSGMSEKSMEAIENIKELCAEYLAGCFELEIIDLYKNPEMASENQVVFSPSLVKKKPLPKKTIVGTLADARKVMKALGKTIE